jgi:hypothetical protein
MSVMASKGLLREMLEDLEAACSLPGEPGADTRLGAKEREACEEAMHYPYFWLQFMSDASAFIERSKRVAASPSGRQAVYCFARGMFMHAKSYGEPIRERLRRLRCVFLFGKAWLTGFWIAQQSTAGGDGRVS